MKQIDERIAQLWEVVAALNETRTLHYTTTAETKLNNIISDLHKLTAQRRTGDTCYTLYTALV